MFIFYDITKNDLGKKAFEQEALYFCTDTGEIFLDSIVEQRRITMNSSVTLVTELPLAPIPNKLYCMVNTGLLYVYYNSNWVSLGSRPHIHFDNIIVENGTLTISDSRILASDTGKFTPDLSVADLASNIRVVCSAGSVKITLASSYPIPGNLVIN